MGRGRYFMIVSHEHGFIFLKTQKTGGTSVELALSQICGETDVITPLTEEDEALRGEVKAQNYEIPVDRRTPLWPLLRAVGKRGARAGTQFHEHMDAEALRRVLRPELFDRYLKVTIVRNPWDREVSKYFWATRGAAERPPFDRWVRRHVSRPSRKTWDVYSVGGRCIADLVLRYETLETDFAGLLERLRRPAAVSLPRAKGAYRPKCDYRQFYTPDTIELVARRHAREIAHFGMRYDQTAG